MLDEPIRGSGRCPRCASRKVETVDLPEELHGSFYAATIEVCGNCQAAWEPLERAQVWDPKDPLCSFREPCDNCAFRPGSPEQRDPERWRLLIADLKTNPDAGFYCHKGVPINRQAEDGFDYPRGRDGKPVRHKLRPCRGWLNMLGPVWAKITERENAADG